MIFIRSASRVLIFFPSINILVMSDPPVMHLSFPDHQAGLIGENPLAALPVQQGLHLLGDLSQGQASGAFSQKLLKLLMTSIKKKKKSKI